jgi:hypothetical protein
MKPDGQAETVANNLNFILMFEINLPSSTFQRPIKRFPFPMKFEAPQK